MYLFWHFLIIIIMMNEYCSSTRTYLKLSVTNSTTDSVYCEEYLEYYFLTNTCMPSLPNNGELNDKDLFDLIQYNETNNNNITVERYTQSDCSDLPIETLIYPLHEYFQNFSQTAYINEPFTPSLFYKLDITTTLPFDLSTSSNWTSLSLYEDDKCEERPYFVLFPTHIHMTSGFAAEGVRLIFEFSYCLNQKNELVFAYGFNQIDDSMENLYMFTHFRNFTQKKCSDSRIAKKFPNSKSVRNSMTYQCRTEQEFLEEVEISFPSKKFFIEEIYYGYDDDGYCLGEPFGNSVTRLIECHGKGKKVYMNETEILEVYHGHESNVLCEGKITYIASGPIFIETKNINYKCFPFIKIAPMVQRDFGYRLFLDDDPNFSQKIAMIVLPSCEGYDSNPLAIEEIKIKRSNRFYFFREDACLVPADWGYDSLHNLLPLGEGVVGMVGRCENGQLYARNYTFKACENINQFVTEDYCVDGFYFGLYVTCISYYCFGFSEYHQDVCNSRGDCIGSDICVCSTDDYYGDECENSKIEDYKEDIKGLWAIFTFPIFGLMSFGICVVCCCCLIVVAIGAIILCFLVIIIICCIVLGCGCVSILGGSSGILFTKLKKFRKLKNVDMLIKEQEMDDDTSIAHLRINKGLFEISMEEIKIIGAIGEGGSNSVVYKAEWKGRTVAFKCFRTRYLCQNQDSFDEFEKEVAVLGNVNHPSIISFYGATMEPPRVGIVMEFCDNGDLDQFLSKYRKNNDGKRYPFEEKYRILLEIISAMDYLHSRSIIHRDIKLENVLLNTNFSSKLMDFGLSKKVDEMNSQKTMRIGTNIYMAPEIVTDSEYDEKCDIFSFSVLIWIFITENRQPYSSPINVELKVANNPNFRPELSLLESWLPREYQWMSKSVVEKCWAHDPSERSSFSELYKEFVIHQNEIEKEVEEVKVVKKEEKKKKIEKKEEDEGEVMEIDELLGKIEALENEVKGLKRNKELEDVENHKLDEDENIDDF